MNKSINELLKSIADPKAEGAEPKPEASPAERLGRALLDELGAVEGVSEDELVSALLEAWQKKERRQETGAEPFDKGARRPMPLKADPIASQPVDYADMTDKQFADFKRLVKKAAADGRKIKL